MIPTPADGGKDSTGRGGTGSPGGGAGKGGEAGTWVLAGS